MISAPFWAYSLVAEAFALNNFFAALVLLLLVEWERRPERVWLLWACGFTAGLAASNHQTIVLLAPGLGVLLIAGGRRLLRIGRRWHHLGGHMARDLGVGVCLIVVGLLPYAYLPIAASMDPPYNWGDPRTPENFWRHVTRADYGTFRLTTDQQEAAGSRVEQLRIFGESLYYAFTPLGVVLAVAGAWWLAKRRPITGLALLLMFLASGPLFVAYTNPPLANPLWQGVLERFYILPGVVFALAIGAGAFEAVQVAARLAPGRRGQAAAAGAAVALLAVPLGAMVTHYRDLDQSANLLNHQYLEDLLTPIEQGALLLTGGDLFSFGVDYLQMVEGRRRDVVVLHTEKLGSSWYVAQVRQQHPDVVIPFDHFDPSQTTAVAQLVEANLVRRPVYVGGDVSEQYVAGRFDAVQAGLSTKVLPTGSGVEWNTMIREQPGLYLGMRYPTRTYPESTWESRIQTHYGYLAFIVGFLLYDGVDDAEAAGWYRTAMRLAPKFAASYKNLGRILLTDPAEAATVVGLWDTYLRLNPEDPQAEAMRERLRGLR